VRKCKSGEVSLGFGVEHFKKLFFKGNLFEYDGSMIWFDSGCIHDYLLRRDKTFFDVLERN
jgi:hypothetical protein